MTEEKVAATLFVLKTEDLLYWITKSSESRYELKMKMQQI